MFFSLILCLLINIFYLCSCQNITKECRMNNQADTCVMHLLLLGDTDYKFPENKVEMNSHCRSIANYEKCIKNYSNKCLDAFPRQVTSVTVYGIAKTNKAYCSNKKKKGAFISIGKCVNSVKSKCDQCMRSFIDNLQGIENYPDVNMRIPLTCCNYHRMKECILKNVEGGNESVCQDSQYTEVERIIDGYGYDVLQMICGDYTEESDKCPKLLPKTPKKLAKQKKPRSLLIPLINILNSIPPQ